MRKPVAAPKLVSLYMGAGGLDLGLEAAGFDLAVGVEIDDEAVATVRANREWHVIQQDIHDVSSKELLKEAGLRVGDVDLLAGGPPCQPFSKSGYWHRGDARRLDDPRSSTLEQFLRVLRDLQPRAFLLENVPGMTFSEKDEGLLMLEETVDQINKKRGVRYSFKAQQLNAAEFGVPQLRERVFVIGHREGIEFQFPEGSFALPARTEPTASAGKNMELLIDGKETYRTAWDAIGHLEEDGDPALAVRGKWADLLPTIPEGQNYLFHTSRGGGLPIFGWRRRYWSMLLKLSKALPSWTLTAQPGPAIGPFHWQNRRLSAQELCALQTFPREYKIRGNLMSAQRQVGNAVPSALAERLGLEIRRQLLGHKSINPAKLSLIPPARRPIPPPEKPKAVRHKKYLGLVGDHEPHPGTGLGPGAVRRQRAGTER